MSASLSVEIETAPVERVAADLLVAPFFSGERPLRGPAARVDWRLCGLLSEQLRSGALQDGLGDAALLATHARLRAPRVLVVAFGPRAGFDASRLRSGARESVQRVLSLGAGLVAFALAEEDQSGVATDRAAAAVVAGVAEAIGEARIALRLRLVLSSAAAGRAGAAVTSLARRGPLSGVPVRLVTAAGEPVRSASSGPSPEGDTRRIAPHAPPSLS